MVEPRFGARDVDLSFLRQSTFVLFFHVDDNYVHSYIVKILHSEDDRLFVQTLATATSQGRGKGPQSRPPSADRMAAILGAQAHAGT